jgi:hypothetical protein
MKKYMLQISFVVVLLGIAPFANAAANATSPVSTPISAAAIPLPQSQETLVLLNRLETIQAMDISGMKSSEKRVLRKEVKSIEKQLKAAPNGGIYISVGAVLIILLLLILFL